ncbi:hypothetical protein PoB_004969200 [Plakobranchus ocellatus]|uniref:Uncharacterized protein n=1 Tax=Plakobranchus ocellatus TaxID=259542 RepID=A0AAV4BV24_9GAST|nr:hypothetical protein PoB_004969200 [Plakobranchus ocellatus]
MRKKICASDTCNSDSRYSSEDYMSGVTFRSFPKPKTQLEKCRGWIRLCISPTEYDLSYSDINPHTDLSVDKIGSDYYVCSKTAMPNVWLGLGLLQISTHPFSFTTQLRSGTVPDTPYMSRSRQR